MNNKNQNLMNMNEISKFAQFDKYSSVHDTLKPWFTKIDIIMRTNQKMFDKEINKMLFIISYLKKIILNWMQFKIEDYLNNEKKNWEMKTI